MADEAITPASIKQKIEQALQAEHVVRTLHMYTVCIGSVIVLMQNPLL